MPCAVALRQRASSPAPHVSLSQFFGKQVTRAWIGFRMNIVLFDTSSEVRTPRFPVVPLLWMKDQRRRGHAACASFDQPAPLLPLPQDGGKSVLPKEKSKRGLRGLPTALEQALSASKLSIRERYDTRCGACACPRRCTKAMHSPLTSLSLQPPTPTIPIPPSVLRWAVDFRKWSRQPESKPAAQQKGQLFARTDACPSGASPVSPASVRRFPLHSGQGGQGRRQGAEPGPKQAKALQDGVCALLPAAARLHSRVTHHASRWAGQGGKQRPLTYSLRPLWLCPHALRATAPWSSRAITRA